MLGYRRRPEALLTELPNRTGLVLNLQKRCYYPLSATGVLLWRLFDNHEVVDEVALSEFLVEKFGLGHETAKADVQLFLKRLVDESILDAVFV